MLRPRHCIVLLLSLLPLWAVEGQDFLPRSELMLGAGGMTYMGDLNNQSLFDTPGPAANIGLRTSFNNRLSARYCAAIGKISGGNPDYLARRNLSFESVVVELTGGVEFNFWSFGTGATDHQWAFYLYGCVGAFYFNPMATYTLPDGSSSTVALQPLHTEGQGSAAYPDRKPYAKLQFCIPFGVGVKWRLNKTFTLNAEYGLRATWTDYLDDVSTTYVEAAVLQANSTDGELAVQLADRSGEVEPGYTNTPGVKRGDDSLNDWYTSFHVGIGINLETLFGWTHKNRCVMRN